MRTSGFTLIELVLVISIMAAIIGITAPRWTKTLNHWRFQTSVNDAVNSIRYARERAILNRKEQEIVVGGKKIVFDANGETEETEETEIEFVDKDGQKVMVKVFGWGSIKLETLNSKP